MNQTHFTILSIAMLFLVSCDKPTTRHSLEGAWLGEGMFSAGAGEQAVKAQLEILSNGSYRFLILEPRLLMLAGGESGKWTKDGARLTLEPINEKSDAAGAGGSVFDKLRQSSPENRRVKQLLIAADLSSLALVEGPMRLNFEPNPKVTRKLEEAGEVE